MSSVPRSIQGLIAARLDGLPDEEKSVLQDAAVVGREFWLGAVVRLSGRPPGVLREVLGRLRVKELIVPHEASSFSDEPEFSFRHLLIRDGAYDSLPKALRASKHTKIAEWAAERAGDRADEVALLIATHHREALRYLVELGDTGQARQEAERAAYRWSRAAGDRATALWLQSDAIVWYEEALGLADAVDAPLAERLATARLHTEACFASATTTENEVSCRRYLALAEEARDERGAGWAQAELARIVFHEGRDRETRELSDAAVRRLEALGDGRELAFALTVAGWYRWRRGRFEEAEPLLRRAVDIAERVGARRELAEATMDLGITLANLGQLEVAVDAIERAYELAMEVGVGSGGLGRIYNNYASIAGNAHPRRAVEVLREGLEMSRKAGAWQYVAWITGSLGDFEYLLGGLAEAEAFQRESIELARGVGDDPLLAMRTIALGQVLAVRGRLDEAQDAYDASGRLLIDNPEPQAEIIRRELAVMIARGRGDASAELAGLRAFADYADDSGVVLDWAPEVFMGIIRRAVELGDRALAERYRGPAAQGVFAPSLAVGAHTAGILDPEPAEQGRLLGDAVDRYDELGLRILEALALMDLGRADARLGRDPRSSFEQARDLLIACDAQLYLPEAEEALAALEAGDPRP